MSRSWLGPVMIVMAASAALGLYFGYSRTAAAPVGTAGDAASTVAATTVAAKTASAIPDSAPAAPVPDETFIRKIAREEVQSALHPRRAAPPPDADDGSDTSDDADAHEPSAPPPSVTPAPLAVPPAPQ